MIIWRRFTIIILVVVFFLVVLFVNIYFLYTVIEDHYGAINVSEAKLSPARLSRNDQKNLVVEKPKLKGRFYVVSQPNQMVASVKAEKKIRKFTSELNSLYHNAVPEYKKIVERIVDNLKQSVNNSVQLWKAAERWVSGVQVLPDNAPLLGSVLNSLCSLKIIEADNSKRGTQLKIFLTLEGGQQALFKPQWYSRNEIIKGPVYAGRDRHNAEVAAFYLSLLLDLKRVPLSVGRKINLRKEIMPVATQELLNTFYQKGNNTCFYGVCLYCDKKNSVCAKADVIEGALIMWLPRHIKFERHANPWQRSYKTNLAARWEVEENYCNKIKETKLFDLKFGSRLLDLIDAAVFDFLLDNGDRHHYEVPTGLYPSSVFLFDNGKSFGNPNADHLDILAPLYQCCVIRKKTWERLRMFSGGSLSSSLEKILRHSHIAPVLTRSHLMAIDRRLIFIFAAVEICIAEIGYENVFL